MTKRLPVCDYWGCGKPLPGVEETDQMRFCDEHNREINSFVANGDVKKILSFWVKARGGAERSARLDGMYYSHYLAEHEEAEPCRE